MGSLCIKEPNKVKYAASSINISLKFYREMEKLAFLVHYFRLNCAKKKNFKPLLHLKFLTTVPVLL